MNSRQGTVLLQKIHRARYNNPSMDCILPVSSILVQIHSSLQHMSEIAAFQIQSVLTIDTAAGILPVTKACLLTNNLVKREYM